jgi:general secretion pathway protein D
MPRATNRLPAAGVLALALLVTGCAAASSATRVAREAETRQDYDLAIVQYTKALRQHPDDINARVGLDRAKLRASQDHFARARRLAATAKLDQALVEYEVAAELNPSNSDIDAALNTTRHALQAKVAVAHEGKTELQNIIERARDLPPPGLDLPSDVKMPASVVFRNASSRDVYLAIARMANMSIAFESTFRDAPMTIDLRSPSLADTLRTVADQTHTFFRVTAPRSVLVIPDTPAKRREYEEEVVQTFPLSNADLKETMDLLRVVLDARRISPTAATNSLTIKDTPENVAAAGRVISAIDKARPEVIIDVELLEVNRTRLQEYGLQLASPGSPGINGSVGLAADSSGSIDLQSLRSLTQSAASRLRWHDGARAVRRPGAAAVHHLCANRHRRAAAAADHVVQLREHRREHRHHTAPSLRRQRELDAQGGGAEYFGNGLRRAADHRQPRNQHDDHAARRRDEHARGADSG